MCGYKTIHQLSVQPGDLPSNFDTFPCEVEVFHQFPSTFCTAERPSVNFPQIFVTSRELRQLSSTFRMARRPSFYFCQLSAQQGDLPSSLTFCAASSSSIKFSCGLETFCQLLSTFCATRRLSLNFRLLPKWL